MLGPSIPTYVYETLTPHTEVDSKIKTYNVPVSSAVCATCSHIMYVLYHVQSNTEAIPHIHWFAAIANKSHHIHWLDITRSIGIGWLCLAQLIAAQHGSGL